RRHHRSGPRRRRVDHARLRGHREREARLQLPGRPQRGRYGVEQLVHLVVQGALGLMRTRWAALVLVFLVAAGCQRQSSARISAEAPATDLADAARAAMASRDWLATAPLFRPAITKTPDDVSLQYVLAICASFLKLRD